MDAIEKIARVCHEANRAWCLANNEAGTFPAWDQCPKIITDSALAGVNAILANPDMTAEQSHDAWMKYKIAEGWTVGDVKDAGAKTHPSLIPYAELPPAVKVKDHLFRAIILALTAE